MLGKKSSSEKVNAAVSKSVNFELTIADLARRSERRAWWVAFSAIAVALILAGGYFYMLPLKEKVPYLVMADPYTGTSTIARLTDDMGHRKITSSEAINRSNVAHFILARESYDVTMMSLRDWKTVQTMASDGVKAGYTAQYSPSNPDSLYAIYGKDRAIRVKLLSIVLAGGSPGVTPKGATVRFQRTTYNKQTGATQFLDSKIATMEFRYKPNLEMDDQNRIENPLGFWVTNYRVDNDYATSVPSEIVAPAPAAVQNSEQTVSYPIVPATTSSAAAPATIPLPPQTQIAPQTDAAAIPRAPTMPSADGVGQR